MSNPQHLSDQRAQRLYRLSLALARFALIAAIPLCVALSILLGIVFQPRSPDARPQAKSSPCLSQACQLYCFSKGHEYCSRLLC